MHLALLLAPYCLLLYSLLLTLHGGIEMDRIVRPLWKGVAFALLFLVVASCAAIPRLTVTYGLPARTGEYTGKTVFLAVQDGRQSRETMGSGAREHFGAPVSLALAVRRGGEEGRALGVFDLPMLLEEAFKRRVEQAGLQVSSESRSADAEISILLKDFFLDLLGRKWRFVMAYEARLVRDGKVLSTQTISGNGERLKLYGHKQADEVVTEVFTDTLNQFDPQRLLRQAGF